MGRPQHGALPAGLWRGGDDAPGIKHYVYMMLENRTYDNVFGARKLLEGKPGDGLVTGMQNPDGAATWCPIHEPPTEMLCVPDPPHGWDPSHAQFNAGAMDGFVTQYNSTRWRPAHAGDAVPDARHLPVCWALADAYTTCDRWFASVMGPTLPNRAYWHAATSFGQKDNNAVLNNVRNVPVPTIYNRLHDKSIDWAYYYGSIAVAAALGNPGPYQLDLGPNDGKTGRIRKFAAYPDDAGDIERAVLQGLRRRQAAAVDYIDPFFGNAQRRSPADAPDHGAVVGIRGELADAAGLAVVRPQSSWYGPGLPSAATTAIEP